MFHGKPIIGVVGGIGSGKSYIADLFGQLGCMVTKSDDQVREAYKLAEVKDAVRQWWGEDVISPNGEVDRKAIAFRVFDHPEELKRLENLIHPLIGRLRDEKMTRVADDPAVKAFVWDTPLLYEVGLDEHCDAVVFVDAPLDIRLKRVAQHRGWNDAELHRRENSQLPLDKKRDLAQYILHNTADEAFARRQVEAVLSRILTTFKSAAT